MARNVEKRVNNRHYSLGRGVPGLHPRKTAGLGLNSAHLRKDSGPFPLRLDSLQSPVATSIRGIRAGQDLTRWWSPVVLILRLSLNVENLPNQTLDISPDVSVPALGLL